MTAALVVERATKRFGDFTAVDRVSLEVPTGSVYGFLGPNGAGKTTTLRMILSILEPDEGRIELLGHSSALEVRERIGYLPEEKGLYKKMKVGAILSYFGELKGMPRHKARSRSRELLERYGLGEWWGQRTEALSKGMQQKVQVLASIVHDPEFVILDEPFSGLDPINVEVMRGVIETMRDEGRTVVFSTHIMEQAERICDSILLIHRGRKILDGTVEEAKQSLPFGIRVRAHGEISALQNHEAVERIERIEGDAPDYELFLKRGFEPQSILRDAFRAGIEVERFDVSDPSLHDVFVRTVGADALDAPESEEVAS